MMVEPRTHPTTVGLLLLLGALFFHSLSPTETLSIHRVAARSCRMLPSNEINNEMAVGSKAEGSHPAAWSEWARYGRQCGHVVHGAFVNIPALSFSHSGKNSIHEFIFSKLHSRPMYWLLNRVNVGSLGKLQKSTKTKLCFGCWYGLFSTIICWLNLINYSCSAPIAC